MPSTYSPLRYPGGKTKLYTTIKPLISCISQKEMLYVEPFAGGAGLALKLLMCGDVSSLFLNDIDENIFLFWEACLNETDQLCQLIQNAELSINEWKRQKEILEDEKKHTDLERAFALLFLNRCNRSGIISGGPIGGKLQTGKYRIDARFNKEGLIKKIIDIGKRKDNIRLYCMDGKDFIVKVCSLLPDDKVFINIDPPYVNKGPELYKNAFTERDHIVLSEVIKGLTQKWVVTYDSDPLVYSLYKEYPIKEITLGYSAGSTRKKGNEYLITNMQTKGV